MSKKHNSQQRTSQRQHQTPRTNPATATINERERRQATVIGASACIIVLSLIVAVIAVVWALNRPTDTTAQTDGDSTSQGQKSDGTQSGPRPLTLQQAQAKAAAAKPAPTHADYKGGFLFSKNGVGKPIKSAPTVQVYTDFICPFCGSVDRQLFPTWNKMLDAGQLNLEIHPCSFLDGSSTDDYSTRSACAAAYIADKDPDHALAFVEAMFDESFQPKEGWEYRPTSNADIVGQAKKAGVRPAVAEQAVKGTYRTWIKAVSDYTPLRSELQHPNGANKGEFGIPTTLVNSRYWDYGAATQDGTPMANAFCNALGLQASAVGQRGVMPAVGSTKGPQA